ncbi:unnamed protein product [Didymodactylos carnosus]|uniref:Uncharacterized protein n=1 Tax=Didymodactylos carnosus TaxID=1234261 RepID=A0A814DY93_9BILA|nr:unnamed protein product [Didymodactylos carnosus]CAF1108323.1 unnamed protein product [Didymodactylos carnosus]CAF3734575.1 unnamed protein product [Didymodactylos carnosus]CAF3873803.1 unnamed protein product [Didymodactylos carnosus]
MASGASHVVNATSDDVVQKLSTSGASSKKYVLITGGNAGIGYAAAQLFLSKKADICQYDVTIVGRSLERLNEAKLKLETTITPDNSNVIHIGLCDISSKLSVDTFIKEFKLNKIDYLINNAGVWLTEYTTSPESHLEMTFATNHLGKNILISSC